MEDYKKLLQGIHPFTNEDLGSKVKKENDRFIAPTSVELTYILQFNFATLIEAVFSQRLWVNGAQSDTKEVVKKIFDLVYEQDLELWSLVEEYYDKEEMSWRSLRMKLKKDNPNLYYELLNKYGNEKSMWD